MGYVATIGMFDGVHLGHQFVLRHVVEKARRRGVPSMAITFDHTMHRDQVLTPLDTKRMLLSKTGIDRIEVLQFTDALRQMTAREFMQRVLKEQLDVEVLLTGYDNRFGHNREEGFDDYVRYGRELGIEVESLPAAPSNGMGMGEEPTVSSSYIRRLLAEGHVGKASEGLGYPYTILGRVAHGEHIGTGLGFPTANLVPIDACQLIPAAGAYAVKVRLEGSMEWKHGMMNIGVRPTFDGHRQTLEVHVFRLNEDLYGQQLLVSFVERLREELRFERVEDLVSQLRKDAVLAEEIIDNR
ncbi:MAG: riboflavin biosynthesis protein RibF [Prevotella sp.]|nr:riboflavin biosynthesis protein RibF [Prevotella sp.]